MRRKPAFKAQMGINQGSPASLQHMAFPSHSAFFLSIANAA